MKIQGLTQRRWAVAVLVNDGLTTKQISQLLGIEARTVNTHIHDIALAWRLDPSKDLRSQIVQRITTEQASRTGNSESNAAA